MTRYSIPAPFGGVSDEAALGKQRKGTTRQAKNVRGYDPRSGRKRISQREGSSKWAPDPVNGANKIAALAVVDYDARNITYSLEAFGAEPTTLSVKSPSNPWTVPVVRYDRQSNRYFVDGASTIVKQNSEGIEVWKLVLPIKQGQAQIRALWIDDEDRIFAATSAGVSQDKCQIWMYGQLNDDKTELKWSVETDAFVEDLCVANGKLFTIQNSSRDQASKLIVYDGLFFVDPFVAWDRKCAYPSNAIAVSPKDNAIFVAAEANAFRGLSPNDPTLSATSTHWTPEQLAFWPKRAWSWVKGDDIDADGTFNARYDDGSSIQQWSDHTGNGRHLYAAAGATAPTYNLTGVAGRGTLRCTDGTGGTTVSGLVSGTNSGTLSSGAAEHGSFLPGYVGAKWALYAVVRCEPSATMRNLIVQNRAGAGAFAATDFGVFLNATSTGGGGAAVLAASAGGVQWYDNNSRIGAAALAMPRTQYWSHEQTTPYERADVMLVTLIVDTNPFGLVATENCTLYVDGRVANRWHCAAGVMTWTTATEIARAAGGTPASAFRGDLCEMLVLREYTAVPGGPTIPVENNAWGSGLLDNFERQRLDGYFGHRWGIAHKFPTGSHGAVAAAAGVQPANNDTVTIDGQVYTFKTALTPAPFEVLRGASATTSLLNLAAAINLTDTANPPTLYGTGTTKHTTVCAYSSYLPLGIGGATDLNLILQSLDPADVAFTVTDTGANITSYAGTTNFQANVNSNFAHEPHPFWLHPVAAVNLGGPPVDVGLNATSPEGLLNDTGPQLAKFDPARGEVKWVVTNPTTTNLGIGGIGYGVAVSKNGYIFSMGPRSSTPVAGPTTDQLRSTNAVFRGLKDLGDTVVVDHTLNLDNTVPWVVQDGGAAAPPPGPWYSPEYRWPRASTDKFDKAFFPWATKYQTWGAVVLNPRGDNITGGFQRLTFLDFQRACGCAVDPNVPDYAPNTPDVSEFMGAACFRESQDVLTLSNLPANGSTVTIGTVVYTFVTPFVNVAGNVFIGTVAQTLARLKAAINNEAGEGTTYGTGTLRNPFAGALTTNATTLALRVGIPSLPLAVAASGTSNGTWTGPTLFDNVLHTKRLVKTAPVVGSPRAQELFAVCGQNVYRAAGGVVNPLVGATGTGVIDAAAQYISAASMRGKLFITDGARRAPLVVDARSFAGSTLVAKGSGQVPPRSKLLATCFDRLVFARGPDNPSTLVFSGKGDPFELNLRPNKPTLKQAFDLDLPQSKGSVPDVVQAIEAIQDDLLIVGCMKSVHRLSGDPAQGAAMHQMTKATGVAFGRSITTDTPGNIYFAGYPEGGVWAMAPGGSPPVEITERTIARRLSGLDWGQYTLELHWDPQREGLWLLQVPYSNPGTAVQRWFWERKSDAWWPDDDHDPTKAPTAFCMLGADTLAQRVLLLGCADGYIRQVDDQAKNDDGEAIQSECLYGPLAPEDINFEYTFDDLAAVMATEQDGCGWEMYATNDPSYLGARLHDGVFPRGRGDFENCRATAAYVAVLLKNAARGETWSNEDLSIDTWAAGIKRRSA